MLAFGRIRALRVLCEGLFDHEVFVERVFWVLQRERAPISGSVARTWRRWDRAVSSGELVLPSPQDPSEDIENAVDEYLLTQVPPGYKDEPLYITLVRFQGSDERSMWVWKLHSQAYRRAFERLMGAPVPEKVPIDFVFEELPNGRTRLAQALRVLREHPALFGVLRGYPQVTDDEFFAQIEQGYGLKPNESQDLLWVWLMLLRVARSGSSVELPIAWLASRIRHE